MESQTERAPSEFNALMDKAGQLFKLPINESTVEWYWGYLKTFPLPKIHAAFDEAFVKENYFPTIATIRKLIEKPDQYPSMNQQGWPTEKEINRSSARSIAKDTLDLVFKKLKGQISKEEYFDGMLDLDKKHPIMRGFTFADATRMYMQGERFK